jgi:uncharacterized Zn finger protein
MWSRSRSRSSSKYGGFSPWPEYVPVAERKARAVAQVAKMAKKGHKVAPVVIEGRTIASTVWGKAWCKALEAQADLANRLGRGRSYVRHNCVIDLQLKGREVRALVQGTELYHARIDFTQLPEARWRKVVEACSGKIGSMVELLQGKISRGVMEVVAHPEDGLFPKSGEMKLSCSCPDSAWMCKHLAAVLYAIGNRLDTRPEQLFALRGVDPGELLTSAPRVASKVAGYQELEGDLSEIFGDALDGDASPLSEAPPSSLAASSAVRPRKAAAPAKKAPTRKAPAPAKPAPAKPARKPVAKKPPAPAKPTKKAPAAKKPAKEPASKAPRKAPAAKKWSWSF